MSGKPDAVESELAQRAKAIESQNWTERIKAMDIESLQRVRTKQQLKSGSAEGARGTVKQAETERRQAAYDSRCAVLPPLYEPFGKEGLGVGVPWSKQLIAASPAGPK